ncbi:MAG: hypothetical protein D8H99_06030 [Streptococcus sp.]|nr:MAG: hypothetical protein D8H99_06030 [Streptococcus sp.]
MTNEYNKITLLYEIAFNKSSQITYTNESVFFETIRTLSNIIDAVELDRNKIINLDMSFLYNLWLEDKNLCTIYKTISSSNPNKTYIEKLIVSIQQCKKSSGNVDSDLYNSVKDISDKDDLEWKLNQLSSNQLILSLDNGSFSSVKHNQHIIQKTDLINFKNEYIKSYFENAKKSGRFLERKYNNDIKRFDFKDAKEHSKFPHIHFIDSKPYYGVTLFLIDKNFPDCELYKHANPDKDFSLHQEILKYLNSKGFKTQ